MSSKGKRSSPAEEDKNYSLYVSLCLKHLPRPHPFKWIKINPFENEVTSSFSPQPTSSISSSITCDDFHYESGSAAVGSILYLFGGLNCDTNQYTNSVSYIDTTTMDTFRAYDQKMLSYRRCPCVLTIGKKIYIFGSWAIGLPPTVWAEVLDTELKSFSALPHPPIEYRHLLESYSINAWAIINNGEKIIFNFFPCSLVLLYNVQMNEWLIVQDEKMNEWLIVPDEDNDIAKDKDNGIAKDNDNGIARIGRDYRFMSRSPVVNNVLYSYDPDSRNVYAFDLHKYQWFEEPVKFLAVNESSFFSLEEISLDDIGGTHKRLPPSLGDIHHLGNQLLCLVFYEDYGYAVETHHLYCVLFRPVVGNPAGTTPSIQAMIEKVACYNVDTDGYFDSVAVCVDESASMKRQHGC